MLSLALRFVSGVLQHVSLPLLPTSSVHHAIHRLVLVASDVSAVPEEESDRSRYSEEVVAERCCRSVASANIREGHRDRDWPREREFSANGFLDCVCLTLRAEQVIKANWQFSPLFVTER